MLQISVLADFYFINKHGTSCNYAERTGVRFPGNRSRNLVWSVIEQSSTLKPSVPITSNFMPAQLLAVSQQLNLASFNSQNFCQYLICFLGNSKRPVLQAENVASERYLQSEIQTLVSWSTCYRPQHSVTYLVLH